MNLRRLAIFGMLAFLVSTVAGVPAVASPDLVPVPDVGGVPRAEAEAALGALGFLVAEFEVAGTPPDTVAAQTPVAGTSLPRGATVILDVRRATSDSTAAPNAVGLSPSAASLAFGSNYVLRFESVAGAAANKGKVVSQLPAMGQPLEIRGLLVLRFVADDALPPKVVVPDTLGLPTADAVRAVGDAGLHARVATTVLLGAPPGIAVAQWPFPGTEFDRYATVDLIVTVESTAPAEPTPAESPVLVPNCVNLTESSARAALDEAGLSAEVVWVVGDPAEAFLVQTQDPLGGATVSPGAVVHLTIVKYALPPPPPLPPATPQAALPDLLGMSLAQAEDVLTALNLWANPVMVDDPSSPPLRVVAQQRAPGTWVDLGSVVTFRVSRPPPPGYPVPVPDFYGRTKSQATALAALAGLSLSTTDVVNPSKPANRVYSQSLPAYSVVPVGTWVTVKIAKHPSGPALATVPDLMGMTESQALATLAAAGLGGSASWVVAPGKPLFKVFSQWPLPGASVPAGSLVSVKIAKAVFGWKTVPALFGLSKAAAAAQVVAAGLMPVAIEVFAPTKPPGRVFDQDPSAGTLKPAGSPVTFRVAKQITFNIPNVVGQTQASAEAELSAAGFGVNVVLQAAVGKPVGRVWDQDPNAGALALPFTVVKIRVQPGPPMAPAPFLIGLTEAQANAAVSAAGFVPSATNLFAPSQPLWQVFYQHPVGGSLLATGSTVHFKVSVPALPPAMVMVPNVSGMTGPQAHAVLAAAGLVGNGINTPTGIHPIGFVYWQMPIAGSGVSTGTVVTFRIAVAPAPALVTVPNLIGRTPTQAQNDLASVGLGSNGSLDINFLKPLHKVYSQNKSPGTLVPAGTVVKWKYNP